MPRIYCGIGDTPKNFKIGTMKECSDKGQIRRYGIYKIDPKILSSALSSKSIKEAKKIFDDTFVKIAGLRGEISKLTRYLKMELDSDAPRKKEVKTLKEKIEIATNKKTELTRKLAEMKKLFPGKLSRSIKNKLSRKSHKKINRSHKSKASKKSRKIHRSRKSKLSRKSHKKVHRSRKSKVSRKSHK